MGAHDDFLKLFLRHEADLRAFLGALIPDVAQRDDVFQEVALTLWKQLDQYDPERSFGAWARGIAARKVLQLRDQRARFPVVFAPETIQAVLDAYERTEPAAPRRLDALRECLRHLPTHARELLEQRYEHNLKPEAIAARSRRTVDAVYQALSRVRARLEECISRRLALEERGA